MSFSDSNLLAVLTHSLLHNDIVNTQITDWSKLSSSGFASFAASLSNSSNHLSGSNPSLNLTANSPGPQAKENSLLANLSPKMKRASSGSVSSSESSRNMSSSSANPTPSQKHSLRKREGNI
jgi:hypothetical protein